MLASQAALCGSTGSREMSVFHTLLAGNSGQLAAPGTVVPAGVTDTAGVTGGAGTTIVRRTALLSRPAPSGPVPSGPVAAGAAPPWARPTAASAATAVPASTSRAGCIRSRRTVASWHADVGRARISADWPARPIRAEGA